jgi:probable phosphoglycerate mutase
VADRFPVQYADWTAGRPVRGRNGEDPSAVGERALEALAGLPPVGTAVVVTHGGTAGRLIERLLDLSPEQRRALGALANCAWSELTVQGGRWRLLRHNSSVLPQPEARVEGVGPIPAVATTPDGGAPPLSEDADAVL